MKKEIFYKHTEVVVDKAYEERVKVDKINIPLTLGLCVLPWLFALWSVVANGSDFRFMFVVAYLTFMFSMQVVKTGQEIALNKRVFLTPILNFVWFLVLLY